MNFTDSTGLSTDSYDANRSKHGAPHVDRRNKQGQNVGRYNKDGTPIPHKGKTPPPIPKSDLAKFAKAAAKLGGAALTLFCEVVFPDETGAGSDNVPRSGATQQEPPH